jgi:hypothetical protein
MPKAKPGYQRNFLPGRVFPGGVLFLDSATKRPQICRLPYRWIAWSVRLDGLSAGACGFRVRAIDLNGYASRSRGRTPNRVSRKSPV